jgi:ParB-like chromosome segregation protein Spo0J
MLEEIKLSSGRIAWIDHKLVEAVAQSEDAEEAARLEALADPDQTSRMPTAGIPAGVKELMVESRAERRHRATVAKAAIDAGVAERIVRHLTIEGDLVAAAVTAALSAVVGLTLEQRTQAMAAAHAQLLAIGDGSEPVSSLNGNVIEGTTE